MLLEALGNKCKVFAHLQPQVRAGYPAIMGMDGMVLGQLLRNKPAGQQHTSQGFYFIKYQYIKKL